MYASALTEPGRSFLKRLQIERGEQLTRIGQDAVFAEQDDKIDRRQARAREEQLILTIEQIQQIALADLEFLSVGRHHLRVR